MTIETYTYNKIRLPDTTVTLDTSSGFYSSSLEIIGCEPTRTPTSVESLSGVVSLSPIRATGESVSELIGNTIRAAGLALDSTNGVTVSPTIMTSIAYAVSASIRGAIDTGAL